MLHYDTLHITRIRRRVIDATEKERVKRRRKKILQRLIRSNKIKDFCYLGTNFSF